MDLEWDVAVVNLNFRDVVFGLWLIHRSRWTRLRRGSGVEIGFRSRSLSRPTQHNHIVGDNLGAVILFAILAFPGTGLEPAFEVNLGAFFQILADNVGELAPGDDVMEFRLLFFLAVIFVGPVEAGGDGKRNHVGTVGSGADFRVAG